MSTPGAEFAKPADYPVLRDVATRWADHDTYDHMNNAVYYMLVDTALGGWLLEAADTDVRRLPAMGLVIESSCKFHRAIRFPERVTVGIRLPRVGRSSVPYEFGLFVGDELAAHGTFVHVYVDRESGRSVPVPPEIRNALESLVPSTGSSKSSHLPLCLAEDRLESGGSVCRRDRG